MKIFLLHLTVDILPALQWKLNFQLRRHYAQWLVDMWFLSYSDKARQASTKLQKRVTYKKYKTSTFNAKYFFYRETYSSMQNT